MDERVKVNRITTGQAAAQPFEPSAARELESDIEVPSSMRFSVDAEHGGLVIYFPDYHRGKRVNLSFYEWVRGRDMEYSELIRMGNHKASVVDHRGTFAAVFPRVKAGKWKWEVGESFEIDVEIFPGAVTEVDARS